MIVRSARRLTQTDGIPDFRGNRLNLDTGAVFGVP